MWIKSLFLFFIPAWFYRKSAYICAPKIFNKDMPKQKTNSGAKKRFKVTGSGKIKRGKAFKRHLLGRKTKKRKAELSKAGTVFAGDVHRVKLMLGLA